MSWVPSGYENTEKEVICHGSSTTGLEYLYRSDREVASRSMIVNVCYMVKIKNTSSGALVVFYVL